MTNILSLAWKRYLYRLEKEPLKTKSITAAIIAALADIIAQRLSSKRDRLHWRRTIAIAIYGLIWGGPSNHFWQYILEHIFSNKDDPLRAMKKVALDQLTYGPLNNIMFMTYISKVIEGRSWLATQRKVFSEYPSVQSRGWRLWPAAQFLNQSFVPIELRVLFINCVSLIWSTFLIVRANTANNISRLPVALYKPHYT